jgi:hypothetical protein
MRTLSSVCSALVLTCLVSGPAAHAKGKIPAVTQAAVKPTQAAQVTQSAAVRKALIEKLYRFSARGVSATPKRAFEPKRGAVVAKVERMARPAPRVSLRQTVDRLPKAERTQVVRLLTDRRLATSLEARRAVAAFLVLRGLQGGKGLPLRTGDVVQMMASKRWSAKRLANLAIVLRTAVGIAQAEKISARAAFTKALKQFGIHAKYSRGVCPA